jgi:hypothetical protein
MAMLPNPRDDDLCDGWCCYDCGASWTENDCGMCPVCGSTTEVKVVQYVSCGRHWHHGEESAGMCAYEREEAARDAYWEGRISDARGQ